MKFSFRNLVLTVCVCLVVSLKAQLAGTYTVPGSFNSIAAAITSLNIAGVSGPVTINIQAGHTETASVGGYSLYAVAGTSSLNTVTFQKSGSGSNPIIYAYTGSRYASEAIQDGIWRFIGADYIHINGIDLTDTRTSDPAFMEFGYGFFRANAYDGCQHNSIRNCSITLKRDNIYGGLGPAPVGSRGIEFVGALPNTHTVSLYPLSYSGSHSYNTIASNTLSNCNYGITLSSLYTQDVPLAYYDRGNTIGGSSVSDGNTILAYGSTLLGGTGVAGAILFRGQADLQIRNNQVNNNLVTSNHVGSSLHGLQGGSNNYDLSIVANTISIRSGTTCPEAYCISLIGSNYFDHSNIEISANSFTGCTSQASQHSFYGIYNKLEADTFVAINNTLSASTIIRSSGTVSAVWNAGTIKNLVNISNNQSSAGSAFTFVGYFAALYNGDGTTATSVTFSNNTFSGINFGSGTNTYNLDFIRNDGNNRFLTVSANTLIPMNVTGTSGDITFIRNTSVTQSLVLVNNNVASNFSLSTTGGTDFYGYYGSNISSASSTVNISNNIFSNFVGYQSNFTGIYSREGAVSATANSNSRKLIYNNRFSGFTTYNNWAGIDVDRLGDADGTGPSAIYGNTITNNAAFADMSGIRTGSISTLCQKRLEIHDNYLVDLSSSSNGNNACRGMLLLVGNVGLKLYKNKVAGIVTTTSATPAGVTINYDPPAGVIGEVEVYNNLIGHVRTGTNNVGNAFSTSIVGISLQGAGHFKFYHNTVYLESPYYCGSICLAHGGGSTLDSRNNILINKMIGASNVRGGLVFSTGGFDPTSNNDLFYTQNPFFLNGFFIQGTTYYTTLASVRSYFNGVEKNAVTEDVVFASTTPSASTYLTPSSTVATQVESGAAAIPGYTTDFFGTARNVSTPDIGAIEGNYIPMLSDSAAPVFSNINFLNSKCSAAGRTLSVQISDPSGVAGGSLSPLLYYKLNSGSYSTAIGNLSAGTSTLGTWTFSLSYSALPSDVVSWFLIAQDASTLSNVSSWPPINLNATAVNNISVTPSPETYTFSMSLAGTYTVGSSGTFTSLTQAAFAYNNACLNGPVTFLLSDPSYSTGTETFPIVFRRNADASATNSLLIVPAANTSVTITNGTTSATQSLLKFENAVYISLDGNNSANSQLNVVFGSDNSNAAAGIWLSNINKDFNNTTHHLQFKELNISSNINNYSYGILASANATAVNTNVGCDIDSVVVRGCHFTGLLNGVYCIGGSKIVGANSQWTIEANTFGPATATAGGLMSNNGIFVQNVTDVLIHENLFRNFQKSYAYGKTTGINAYLSSSNMTITSNVMHSFLKSPLGDVGAVGIGFDLPVANANVLIANNMISGMEGMQSSAQDHAGISIYGQQGLSGGFKIYHNSIALTQAATYSTISSRESACISIQHLNDIDIRNNLLSTNVENTGNSFSRTYCIKNAANASYPITTIDYNNYHLASPQANMFGPFGYTAATLPDMQAITGQDQNSISFAPFFVSATDLHLDPTATANSFLNNKGTALTAVITDIDQQSRNVSTPDIGADEFSASATCTSAVAGTISPAASSICVTQSLNILPNNLSGGIGATYQWEVATVAGGTYTNIANGSGANTFQYNTAGSWAPGVYYLRLHAACPSASLSGFSNEYTLSVAAQPTLTVSGYSSSICSGSSLTLTASGATTYTWSTNSTSASIVVNPIGNTNYFVTAANAPCPAVVSANMPVNVLTVPTLTTSISSSTICTGKTATISVAGALSYSWNTGANTATIIPTITASGTNTFTVTGYNGICSATVSRTLNAFASPTLSISGPTAACAGQTLNLSVSGSSLASWSTGSSSKTITVTAPLVYTVTGTTLGCSSTLTGAVTSLSLPPISISPPSTTVCAQNTVTFTASGASSYSWSNGGGNAATSTYTASSSVIYTVSGIDANTGCTGSQTVAVTTNSLPVLAIFGPNTVCAGQSATLLASGASTYLWNTTATTPFLVINPGSNTNYILVGSSPAGCSSSTVFPVSVSASPTLTVSSSSSLVCAGSAATLYATGASNFTWTGINNSGTVTVFPNSASVYTVLGSNAGGCAVTETIAIATLSLPIISVSPPSATVCAQSTLNLNASGATSYTWSNGGGNASSTVYTVITSGVYTVSGIDTGNGCLGSKTVAVTSNSLPVISVFGPTAVCAGETATLLASGANSYIWNTTATTPFIVINPSSNTNYLVAGTSAAGCSSSTLFPVSVNALPVLTVNASPTLVCAGSQATLSANGAQSYTWINVGTTATVSVNPTSLTNYTVLGLNSAGCSASQTISIATNSLPVVTISPSNASVCLQTPINYTATGAASYTWSNGGGNNSTVSFTPSAYSVYTVNATDISNGCVGSQTVAVNTLSLPILSISGSNSVCIGQSITLTASGASSYSWSSGGLSASINVSPVTNFTYNVSGTNAAGCVSSTSFAVQSVTLPLVSISGPTSTCLGETAIFTGIGADSYSWSTGAVSSSVGIAPSSNTLISVTGINNSGCSANATTSLTILALPTLSLSQSAQSVCPGAQATLSVNGAVNYQWSTSQPTSSIVVSPLVSSVYSVTGTSSLNCSATGTVALAVYNLPNLSISPASASSCPQGTLTFTASGVSSYTWSNGSTNSSYTLIATTNTVLTLLGSDAVTGCTNTATAPITVYALPLVTITGPQHVCEGSSATFQASGAQTYSWSEGSSTAVLVLSPVASSVLVVNGVSADGCENTQTHSFTLEPLPIVQVNLDTAKVCLDDALQVIATGANSYTWLPENVQGSAYTPAANIAGTYTVWGADAYGCKNSDVFVMEVDTCTGVSELALAGLGLEIFPNPSSGAFQIKTNLPGVKTIRVLNTLGQCVFSGRFEGESFSVELLEKAKGMYSLQLHHALLTREVKLVLQ